MTKLIFVSPYLTNNNNNSTPYAIQYLLIAKYTGSF